MVKDGAIIRQRTAKQTTVIARTRTESQTPVAATVTKVSGEAHKFAHEAHRREIKQRNLLQLQQQFGNRHIMRVLADPSRLTANFSLLQRDDTPKPSNPVVAEPPLKEVTVPIPAEHPVKAPSGATGTAGETPAAPEQAKIRIPLDLDFHLLPPKLQIRLLDDLSLTAAVTEANLKWKYNKLNLGLGYEYGGKVFSEGSYRAAVGTFSSKASYDPGASAGQFDLGFERDKWRVNATYGTVGNEFGAGLSYGMKPLPDPEGLKNSVTAGEQGARHVLSDLPAVADPTKLPKTLETHKKDFADIGKAVPPIVDLVKRDTGHIDWGFYLRFTKKLYDQSGPYADHQGQDEYKVTAGVVGNF